MEPIARCSQNVAVRQSVTIKASAQDAAVILLDTMQSQVMNVGVFVGGMPPVYGIEVNCMSLDAFEDPHHPGNGPKHHTGKNCIEPGCTKAAGTFWGAAWCFTHNVERIKRVGMQMENLLDDMKKRD